MIDAMPRPRPPHLQREITRHVKSVWYVRIGKSPRIRICAAFGTPEFAAEYEAALSGIPRARKSGPSAGTLGWLIARYRETAAWSNLSPATRKQRDNIFLHVIETAGTKPFNHITAATILAGRDRRATTLRAFIDMGIRLVTRA